MIAVAAVFVGYSVLKWHFLLRRPVVVQVGPEEIELYDEASAGLRQRSRTPKVGLPWSEVKRIVDWRRSGGPPFGMFYRVAMLGIEPVHPDRLAPGVLDQQELEAVLGEDLDDEGARWFQEQMTASAREGVPHAMLAIP